jgi:hypothetical protein
MVYLVVGLDSATYAGWHRNILARDVATATHSARERAAAEGVDLLVAAVIGPNSSVVDMPENVVELRPRRARAAGG